jgi:hypothetical protein
MQFQTRSTFTPEDMTVYTSLHRKRENDFHYTRTSHPSHGKLVLICAKTPPSAPGPRGRGRELRFNTWTSGKHGAVEELLPQKASHQFIGRKF